MEFLTTFASLFSNFGNLTWQMVVMWAVGGLLIYLAIAKQMEPSLLLPMGFGAILVNLPLSGAITQGETVGPITELFRVGMSNELFPLLLLAVDLWVQEGRRWPLALAACINLLTNYVFFVGEVVFLAVYYLVRWLIPDVRRGVRRLPGCMALGGLGVAMGAVLFVPSVLFLLSNPRTQQHGVSLLFSKDELLYLVRSMLLPASSMHSPDVLMENHWASCALWLPMGGLVLAVIYCFGAKKGDWLRRLFLLCLLATLSPALNGAFLLWTQSGYRRWFYMLLLLAALAAARVLEAPERYPVRR